MRTTDIPRFLNVVAYYEEQLANADAQAAALQQTTPDSMDEFKSRCVGLCSLSIENEPDVKIPIYLADEFFKHKCPEDWYGCPLASIARLTGDEIVIYVNTITRNFALDPLLDDISAGILAHECGHYVAGHLAKPELMGVPKPSAEIDWESVTLRLLNGSLAGSAVEHEANLHAISLVGIGAVLTNIVMQSSRSANLGVRMEFSNQLHQLITLVGSPDFEPPATKYYDFGYEILSDALIETIETGMNEETF